jgi:hypothetical protein
LMPSRVRDDQYFQKVPGIPMRRCGIGDDVLGLDRLPAVLITLMSPWAPRLEWKDGKIRTESLRLCDEIFSLGRGASWFMGPNVQAP